MKLFRADIYRDHRITELLVQAKSEEEAMDETKRAWQGWKIRSIAPVFPLTRTWKINEWTTD